MKYLIAVWCLLSGIGCRDKSKMADLGNDQYYTCSMHPQVMLYKPGKCPVCGMELIAVRKTKETSGGALILSDQQVQLGNIHADTIGKTILGDKAILTATLNMDESKTVSVNARIAGRIEKLFIRTTGEFVHKGEHVYDLYSEELNNAKQQFLLALDRQKLLNNSVIDFKQLVESSRNKLLLWGMSENQVNELAKTKVNSPLTGFFSPFDGYVSMVESHEGDYVSEGTGILRLANLSSLWAEAQVYTSQLAEIDTRAAAVVQLPDLSKEIKGRIIFVNPEINPATRVNLIRVSVPNPDGLLKPGMQAYVILNNRQSNTLTLRADAIIRNEKGNRVWLMTGHNTFKCVRIQTGQEDGERVEIRAGLQIGDMVVTSGVYLLNSEYIIRHGTEPND